MKINQAGIDKLKAAMETEAEFFRDYACEPSLKELAEVFKANSDIPNGTLSINNAGIARLYFKSDTFACTYYQFANKKV